MPWVICLIREEHGLLDVGAPDLLWGGHEGAQLSSSSLYRGSHQANAHWGFQSLNLTAEIIHTIQFLTDSILAPYSHIRLRDVVAVCPLRLHVIIPGYCLMVTGVVYE